MTINANLKNISTTSIDRLFIQGELNADIIKITLDKYYNNIDISDCTFIMKGVNSAKNQIEQVLIKTVTDDDKIILAWTVNADFTAVAGKMELELRGTKESTLVIKYKMPPIIVHSTPQGTDLPVADLIEQATNQMQTQVGTATTKAQSASDYYTLMKTIAVKTPYIQNGYWWVYNTTLSAFVDSGVKAQGEQGLKGEKGDAYNLTAQDKIDIASNVTAYVPVTQAEYRAITQPLANVLYVITD